ncbi:MAG: hypothetical protein V4580_11925 [Bacteroidota bacterium]
MKSLVILVFCTLFGVACFAQKDSSAVHKKDTFNRKKEIVYDSKRYRVYNNWLSVGAGANYNTRWPKDERNTSADFSFHIKEQYLRIGGFMSGREFTASNNYSFHLGYGLRKEALKYNLSAFIGPSLSYFRRPLSDSLTYDLATVYNEVGGYAVVEAVFKFKYDVGFGGQIFCDYNRVQMVYGVRLIAYFSGAYRGIKPGYRGPAKKK